MTSSPRRGGHRRSAFVVVSVAVVALGSVMAWRALSAARPAETVVTAPAPPPPVTPTPQPDPPALPAAPSVTPPQHKAETAPKSDKPLDEPQLMARLRQAAKRDPALALSLAREGNRRFPSSPDAPERSSVAIHALVDLGRGNEARGEAEKMVNDSPDSEWVREVERFTGAHRHRNIRVNDAGVLEYR